MPAQRLDYIDAAKGIGILFVICSHSRSSDLMWFAWEFCIPVFFVLSGYTYRYKDMPFPTFIAKKADRLLTPYVFTNILMLAILAVIGKATLDNVWGALYSRFSIYPFGDPLYHQIFHRWCAPTWFLSALFTASIWVYFTRGDRRRELLAIPLFLLITYGFLQLPILLPWSLDTSFYFAAFILAGKYVREYDIDSKPWWLMLIITALYFIIIEFDGDINHSVRILSDYPALAFIASVFGSVVIIWLSKRLPSVLMKPLTALGRNSLWVFCIHYPIISTFNIITLRTLVWGNWQLFYAIGVCFILLTAVICYYIALLLPRIFPFLKS